MNDRPAPLFGTAAKERDADPAQNRQISRTSEDAWMAFATEEEPSSDSTPQPPEETPPPVRVSELSSRLSGVSAQPLVWAVVGVACLAMLAALYVLERGGTQPSRANRAAAAGGATINSRPAGLQVLVDDEIRGTTPLTLTLPPGDHRLQIRMGDELRSIPLVIEAGASISHFIDLGTAPPPSTGLLDITSEPPGSIVKLDGVVAGKTPLMLPGVTAGDHLIAVGAGATAFTRTVTVVAGATASVVASLAPPSSAGGWVRFKVPIEVQVLEEGRLIGTSSMDRLMLPAGVHELVLENASLGWRTTASVQVVAGRSVDKVVAVANGTLSVNAVPWADLTIDGKPAGTTPLANITLPIGSHEIVFTHPQLGERRRTVAVMANGPTRVGVDFGR